MGCRTNQVANAITGFDATEMLFMGHIKSIMYETKIAKLQHIQERMTNVCHSIPRETFETVKQEIKFGLFFC